MKRNRSYFFVLLASILWGSVAAVAKLLLVDLNNLQVLFFANLFAFVGLFLIVIFRKERSLIRTYTKNDYFNFAWMGFLGVFAYNFFLYGGLQLLPAQEAFIINYLWPIAVVAFAVLILKESITARKILAITLSFLGVVMVISKGSFSGLGFGNMLGIFSAIAGALTYGLFSVLGKKHDYDKLVSMTFYYFFSCFYALAALLIFSDIPSIGVGQFLGLLWLGLSNGLAPVFWFLALKHGDTAKMSNMIFLTPFVSLVYIHFLLKEEILASSILGLTVIVLGILIQYKRGVSPGLGKIKQADSEKTS